MDVFVEDVLSEEEEEESGLVEETAERTMLLVEGLVEPCGRDESETCQVGGSAAASHSENSGEAKGKRGFVRWVSGIHRYSNKATGLMSG